MKVLKNIFNPHFNSNFNNFWLFFFKKSFKRFTKELFFDMMSSPIDANFLIKDLESYGLTKLKYNLFLFKGRGYIIL